LEGVVLLQQRIRNEDMGARWRGEGYKPIIVGDKSGRGELNVVS
jgi:phosphoketolase